jgi:hypothetical protein
MFRSICNLGLVSVIAMATNGCGRGVSREAPMMATTHELVFKVKGLT